MFKSKGKHARKRVRVSPLAAIEFALLAFAARGEALDAIAAAELAQLAQS
jgi:hypothetical protein